MTAVTVINIQRQSEITFIPQNKMTFFESLEEMLPREGIDKFAPEFG